MTIVLKLALLLLLILINAFFAMSEIALISLNDNKTKKMAESGNKKAINIIKLTGESSRFLSTIQVGVTLAGFLTSASASQNFAQMLNSGLTDMFNISSATGQTFVYGLSVFIITLITSYFSLVLGELVPKKIAMQKAEAVSFAVVGPLLFVRAMLKPLIALLTCSTNGVVRLFGLDPNARQEEVTEEEIRMLVDVGEESGVIEESQRNMINNIFEFDDITVEDVMRHRTEIIAIDVEDSIYDVITTAIEEGYSRIPVFEEDLDNIIGIIYVKDLLKLIGNSIPTGVTPKSIMRTAFHVPESKRCVELFKEMTENRIQMAVVVDEYGGTAGLVTLEDLIESILGSIQDEYDNENVEILKLEDNTFTIKGVCDIEEVEDMLAIEFPEGDYDTMGGLFLSILGRIPNEDEQPSIEYGGYKFTVLIMDERHIDTVKAEKILQTSGQSQ